MAKTHHRSSSKRSRTSNDSPSNPVDGDNNTTPKSEASSKLDSKMAKLSLPDKVITNIAKNANAMQQSFAEMLQRQLALNKISAQDHDGAHIIVKSAKVDKRKHCPITAPKRFQDDKEIKQIQEDDDKVLAKLEEDKSDLIRKSASRILELCKEEHKTLQLTAIHELAIDIANNERVRVELLELKCVPADVTDVQLGNTAAMEYIATNMMDEDAAKYQFKSAEAFAAAYAELHHVPVPKEDEPPPTNTAGGTEEEPPLTQPPPDTADATMEEAEVNPLTNNVVCKTVITKTKNVLTELWPLMTLPFWEEYRQAEIHRIVNKDAVIRSKSKKQEEANRQVTLNLEDLKDNPEKLVEELADTLTVRVAKNLKSEEQKSARRKESRKKSSGKSKTSQDTKPTNNGQSKRNKSKKNSKKQGQQSNSQQQKNAESSSNNNNNPNSHAGRGRGRGSGRGRNHRGGGGRGRGRGGRRN